MSSSRVILFLVIGALFLYLLQGTGFGNMRDVVAKQDPESSKLLLMNIAEYGIFPVAALLGAFVLSGTLEKYTQSQS